GSRCLLGCHFSTWAALFSRLISTAWYCVALDVAGHSMRLLLSSIRVSQSLPSSPPSGPGWAHELKHDGYRLQIHIRDGRVRLFTTEWGRLVEARRNVLEASKDLGTMGTTLAGSDLNDAAGDLTAPCTIRQ